MVSARARVCVGRATRTLYARIRFYVVGSNRSVKTTVRKTTNGHNTCSGADGNDVVGTRLVTDRSNKTRRPVAANRAGTDEREQMFNTTENSETFKNRFLNRRLDNTSSHEFMDTVLAFVGFNIFCSSRAN